MLPEEKARFVQAERAQGRAAAAAVHGPDDLMNRIQSNYRFVISFNGGLIALGILAPATSATLHNLATLGIGLRSMTNLLPSAKA